MRFAALGSGSAGNALLIEGEGTRVLLDCGFQVRELERRLGLLGISAADLSAILITHEHQDHIRGAGALARRYGIPVWLTHGTWRSGRLGNVPELGLIHDHRCPLRIGAFEIRPFPIPHDAREPVQFVFQMGPARLGVLTDVGRVTAHIMEMLAPCNALFIECNHDPEMLANGPYPPHLQRRVGGDLGHLSNEQAAEFVRALDHAGLDHLIAGHLSRKNNTPQRVQEVLVSTIPGIESRLSVTGQEEVSAWFSL